VNELRKSALIKDNISSTADLQGYRKLMLDAVAPHLLQTLQWFTHWQEIAIKRSNTWRRRAEQHSELMACIRFPAFDLLRSDTRYAGFMRKLDLPQ
jgi:hypothetical protein